MSCKIYHLFIHLKLTKNIEIVSLCVKELSIDFLIRNVAHIFSPSFFLTLTTLNILLNSLQGAYSVTGIVIDCAYFIAEFPVEVDRLVQRRNQIGEVVDAMVVRRAHFLSPMF